MTNKRFLLQIFKNWSILWIYKSLKFVRSESLKHLNDEMMLDLIDQQKTNRGPTEDQQKTNRRPKKDQQKTYRRPTEDQQKT